MTSMQKVKQGFLDAVREHRVPLSALLTAEALGVEKAIGDPTPYQDFALQRGVEKLLQVSCLGARGQAFTSHPWRWQGTLKDVLSLELSSDRNRALLIAAMNAVAAVLGLVEGTVHCQDNGPQECAVAMAEAVAGTIEPGQRIGIVGYQPAILDRFVQRFGCTHLCQLDLNPANIGKVVCGVTIWDGEKHLERMADECSLCLATGSALVNGSLDRIQEVVQQRSRKLLLYGTTIAYPALILGLPRLCYRAG